MPPAQGWITNLPPTHWAKPLLIQAWSPSEQGEFALRPANLSLHGRVYEHVGSEPGRVSGHLLLCNGVFSILQLNISGSLTADGSSSDRDGESKEDDGSVELHV